MTHHMSRPQSTFVIRLWREQGGKEAGSVQEWQGRIEHLQSGEGITFRHWDQLLEFMQHLGVSLELPEAAVESQDRSEEK